jgi:hypothetical protein
MGRAYADKNGQVWIEDNRTQRKPLKPYYIVTEVPRCHDAEPVALRIESGILLAVFVGLALVLARQIIVWLAQ